MYLHVKFLLKNKNKKTLSENWVLPTPMLLNIVLLILNFAII